MMKLTSRYVIERSRSVIESCKTEAQLRYAYKYCKLMLDVLQRDRKDEDLNYIDHMEIVMRVIGQRNDITRRAQSAN